MDEIQMESAIQNRDILVQMKFGKRELIDYFEIRAFIFSMPLDSVRYDHKVSNNIVPD